MAKTVVKEKMRGDSILFVMRLTDAPTLPKIPPQDLIEIIYLGRISSYFNSNCSLKRALVHQAEIEYI